LVWVVVVVAVAVAVAVAVRVYLTNNRPNNGQKRTNMRGVAYTAGFYKAEVERLTLALTQSVGPEQRVQLQKELASAREHLANTK
jgi:hypothetical protein